LGFGGKPLGLCLGAGDDCLSLVLGFLLLALICGKQGLSFCLEPARLVELRLDAFPPVVDALEQELVRPEITEHADEDDKGDRDPELGFKHWLPQRLSALLTASVTSSPAPCAGASGPPSPRRRDASQPLDNRACSLAGDAAHVPHRRRSRAGNSLLRFGDTGIEFRVHLLATGFGCCRRLCTRLIGEGLRPSACLR